MAKVYGLKSHTAAAARAHPGPCPARATTRWISPATTRSTAQNRALPHVACTRTLGATRYAISGVYRYAHASDWHTLSGACVNGDRPASACRAASVYTLVSVAGEPVRERAVSLGLGLGRERRSVHCTHQ